MPYFDPGCSCDHCVDGKIDENEVVMEKPSTSQKVEITDVITEAIRNDSELYYGYQANIAMAFVDEYDRCSKKYKNRMDIHDIASKAAKNFLDLWIRKYPVFEENKCYRHTNGQVMKIIGCVKTTGFMGEFTLVGESPDKANLLPIGLDTEALIGWEEILPHEYYQVWLDANPNCDALQELSKPQKTKVE